MLAEAEQQLNRQDIMAENTPVPVQGTEDLLYRAAAEQEKVKSRQFGIQNTVVLPNSAVCLSKNTAWHWKVEKELWLETNVPTPENDNSNYQYFAEIIMMRRWDEFLTHPLETVCTKHRIVREPSWMHKYVLRHPRYTPPAEELYFSRDGQHGIRTKMEHRADGQLFASTAVLSLCTDSCIHNERVDFARKERARDLDLVIRVVQEGPGGELRYLSQRRVPIWLKSAIKLEDMEKQERRMKKVPDTSKRVEVYYPKPNQKPRAKNYVQRHLALAVKARALVKCAKYNNTTLTELHLIVADMFERTIEAPEPKKVVRRSARNARMTHMAEALKMPEVLHIVEIPGELPNESQDNEPSEDDLGFPDGFLEGEWDGLDLSSQDDLTEDQGSEATKEIPAEVTPAAKVHTEENETTSEPIRTSHQYMDGLVPTLDYHQYLDDVVVTIKEEGICTADCQGCQVKEERIFMEVETADLVGLAPVEPVQSFAEMLEIYGGVSILEPLHIDIDNQ